MFHVKRAPGRARTGRGRNPSDGDTCVVSPAAHALPTLIDGAIELRPSQPSDVGELLMLLAEPAVAAWWGDNTHESVTEEIEGAFTILIDGGIAGILECHEETDETYPSVAFDIMLGTAHHGLGYGRRALRLAIDHFISRGHHRFTIDPTVANEPAVRCYRAVGFRPVGILREAERAPSGEWRDALLMDLLARDLK